MEAVYNGVEWEGSKRGWAGGGEGSWRPGVSNSSISSENPEFLNDLGSMWEIILTPVRWMIQ